MKNLSNVKNAEKTFLQVKHEQSAGYDIIELETNTLNPGFNIIHTSIDCKEVLNIPDNYYVELKLRSSAGQLGLVITAGIIDNYYDGCLCYEIFNFSNVPQVFEKGKAYIQAIYHKIYRPSSVNFTIKKNVSTG